MTLVIALAGALGVWLTFMAVTHKFIARLGADHEDLAHAAQQVRMGDAVTLTAFSEMPFLDRALRPLLEPASIFLARLFRRLEADEERLAQAGHPRRYQTAYDLYAWKALAGAVLFAAGLANALLAGTGSLPVAFGLGLVGLFLPDYHLNQLIRKRREALRTEMAFVLHRLVIHLESSNTMPMAIERVTEKPGGPFVRELREVLQDFNTGKFLGPAMQNLAARNPGIEDVARFAELVIRADRLGQPLSQPLRNMANVMQAKVEAKIESSGLATSVKMVLPIGLLVLPAIGIVAMGPAVYLAAQYLLR